VNVKLETPEETAQKLSIRARRVMSCLGSKTKARYIREELPIETARHFVVRVTPEIEALYDEALDELIDSGLADLDYSTYECEVFLTEQGLEAAR
jgi:hypothetical protein